MGGVGDAAAEDAEAGKFGKEVEADDGRHEELGLDGNGQEDEHDLAVGEEHGEGDEDAVEGSRGSEHAAVVDAVEGDELVDGEA